MSPLRPLRGGGIGSGGIRRSPSAGRGPDPAEGISTGPLRGNAPAQPEQGAQALRVRLGCVLRAARERRGLTQEALAEAAGFERTYPSMVERGLREPKLSTFIRLCNAAEVSPLLVLAELLTPGVGRTRPAHVPDRPRSTERGHRPESAEEPSK
jgi:DNA-binding XRE family transcriptional regulator